MISLRTLPVALHVHILQVPRAFRAPIFPSFATHPTMDRSNLENANPTILSVSQLPSRKRKGVTARRGPDSKCDSIVFPKRAWPYGTNSSSDEEDDDDDEIGEQPLDEQDIYGEHTPLLV